MTVSMPPKEGDCYTYERMFTKEEVLQFGEISNDKQAIHTEPDEDNRLVVHGLLTATLPTKIGGDLSVLARTMDFEFYKPVYTDTKITCVWENKSVTEEEDRYNISASITCTDESDTVVAEATITGLVWK